MIMELTVVAEDGVPRKEKTVYLEYLEMVEKGASTDENGVQARLVTDGHRAP